MKVKDVSHRICEKVGFNVEESRERERERDSLRLKGNVRGSLGKMGLTIAGKSWEDADAFYIEQKVSASRPPVP